MDHSMVYASGEEVGEKVHGGHRARPLIIYCKAAGPLEEIQGKAGSGFQGENVHN